MATINSGDRVRIHYTGRFPGGEVFDSSAGRDPLEFTAGGSEVIPGMSDGVIGLAIGDKKTLTIPPEQAYGERRDELIQSVPRDVMPEDVTEGDRLRATAGEHQHDVWVREIDDEHAVLDANHPLAGETLEFDVEIVEIHTGT